jgi:hypothetical protein
MITAHESPTFCDWGGRLLRTRAAIMADSVRCCAQRRIPHRESVRYCARGRIRIGIRPKSATPVALFGGVPGRARGRENAGRVRLASHNRAIFESIGQG